MVVTDGYLLASGEVRYSQLLQLLLTPKRTKLQREQRVINLRWRYSSPLTPILVKI